MTATTTFIGFEELSRRASDGVEVALLWRRRDGSIRVAVEDSRSGDRFQVDVEPAKALDAYEHPYAYAAFAGVEYREPATVTSDPVAA
jgi:hypothetical protein